MRKVKEEGGREQKEWRKGRKRRRDGQWQGKEKWTEVRQVLGTGYNWKNVISPQNKYFKARALESSQRSSVFTTHTNPVPPHLGIVGPLLLKMNCFSLAFPRKKHQRRSNFRRRQGHLSRLLKDLSELPWASTFLGGWVAFPAACILLSHWLWPPVLLSHYSLEAVTS